MPPRHEADLLARLCQMAAEQVAVDPSTVAPDSDFFTDLNFDSLDAVEYTMAIEDEFDLSVDDHQADLIRTPRQACEMLLAAQPAATPSDE